MAIQIASSAVRINTRQLGVWLLLLPVFAGVHLLAYWLRFDGQLGPREWTYYTATVTWVVLAKALVCFAFRVHQGWGRYATFHDLLTLLQASTLSSVSLALADYLLLPGIAVPRSVFLMDWGFTIVVVGGLRALPRLLTEGRLFSLSSSSSTPVFIVGANDTGESLLREIRRNRNLPYRVVGFISDGQGSQPSCISGVPVIGDLERTTELALKHGVREVLITAGKLSGHQVRQLVESGRRDDVAVKVLPSLEQLLSGKVDLRPRTVSIEDLLRRNPVRLDMGELHRWIDGKTVLVTGSAGSIGSEICRQLLQFSPRRLVLVDRSENGQFFLQHELKRLHPGCDVEFSIADVADGLRMNHLFRHYQPEIVFHAAAYKHVPLMEANPGEAVKNIPLATRLLADLAHQQSVESFVMISTDKAVNPTSVMGACKRVAECYVQALAARSKCRFVTVRFGNVLDSAGSVIPLFREQIARGGPVTITDPKMQRYFMTIPEASQLVIQAGGMGRGGEIFVLDMGEPVRIMDLAADMIRLSGLRVGEDVAIEVVGLRPGEKLFEELLIEGEQHLPTSHPKILVAAGHEQSYERVRLHLQHLRNLADGPVQELIQELKQLVPTFRSQQDTPQDAHQAHPSSVSRAA